MRRRHCGVLANPGQRMIDEAEPLQTTPDDASPRSRAPPPWLSSARPAGPRRRGVVATQPRGVQVSIERDLQPPQLENQSCALGADACINPSVLRILSPGLPVRRCVGGRPHGIASAARAGEIGAEDGGAWTLDRATRANTSSRDPKAMALP